MEAAGSSEVLWPVSAKVVIDASPKTLIILITTVRTCGVTSRHVGGVEVQGHLEVCLTSALDKGERSASRLGRFIRVYKRPIPLKR
jgi:hypothetical protein